MNATPNPFRWLPAAALIVAVVTGFRIVMMGWNQTDLFVDEVQYWLWGQDIDFGYYSKPPLIAWVIRAMTEIAGSDAPFWVRLPAPLFHAVTAMILGAAAQALWAGRAGVCAAALYITLPIISVGSFLISTDTIMFPFLSGALMFWFAMLKRPSGKLALAAGALLGVAALAKYAAVYYILCAGLAAVFVPAARPTLRQAGLALAAFLVVLSPNIIWNIANGLSTVQHTLDNADWVRDPATRAGLNFAGLAEFFGAQFIVFGPILFTGLLWLLIRWSPQNRSLLLFSLPIVALVCLQALLSNAYANWAAAAYLAGTLVIVPLVLRHRWTLWASLALHSAFALFVPIAAMKAQDITVGEGRLLMARYLGRVQMSEAIMGAARDEGLKTIVVKNRDLLADLFYTGRDSGLTFHAPPPKGRAANHYELSFPLPSDATGEVLFVIRPDFAPTCAGAPLRILAPEEGAYRGQSFGLYQTPASCPAQ
ncbi:glycosyltransferase family 39 protein [Alphaproteobacteria bacterium KMM 3653]|uniref:Glycosyltransferase family 39 protein n=1 Tax=Harenicola maris TaxID=2841044 RepID=A0AAP2CPP2_9RHOB|nr:glycosyltransferase family 39 protein [Harenicola maris]